MVSDSDILALALTGYGKDLLKGILGADCPVVETIAHATAGLHFFPDADCICDVGGVDVKIMILQQRRGDRLPAQLAVLLGQWRIPAGRGRALQYPDERHGGRRVPGQGDAATLHGLRRVPAKRHRQPAAQGMAGRRDSRRAVRHSAAQRVDLCRAACNNLQRSAASIILQGGTHRNLAVVKTQVDFIRGKVPDAEVVVHPYSGEAGAIGAALVALDWWKQWWPDELFRGFEAIAELTYKTTTSSDTVCHWCPVNCQRSFIDVQLLEGQGTAVEQGAPGRGLGAGDQ